MLTKYFTNAGVIAISELVLSLRGLLLIPLLTRQFGPINYGVWAQVSIIVVTLTPFISLGTDSAVLRFLPAEKANKQKSYFSAWLVFMIAISAFISIPIIGWRNEISALFFGEAGEYARLIPLAIVVLVVSLTIGAMRSWFRVQNNAVALSLLGVGRTILNIGAAFLMLVRNDTVYELIIYTIIADLLVLLSATIAYSRTVGWAIPDFSVMPTFLKYGIPLVPSALAVWGLNYSDRLIIINFQDLFQIGIYSVAYSLGTFAIESVSKPLRVMLQPSLSDMYNRGDFEGVIKLFRYSTNALNAICLPAVMGLFLLGKPIITLVASADFSNGGIIIGIVALAYYFLKMAGNFNFLIGLKKKTWLQSVSTIIAATVNVSLNFFLIPRIGILGAAIATLLGFMTNFVASYIFALPYKVVQFDFRFIGKVFAATIFMGTTLTYILQRGTSSFAYTVTGLVIMMLVGAFAYVLGLTVLGIITEERVKSVISVLNIRN